MTERTELNLRPVNLFTEGEFSTTGGEFNLLPTGTDVASTSRLGVLPEQDQHPVSLTLTVARDRGVGDEAVLEVRPDSVISTGPRGRLTLTSDTDLIVDGSLIAPGGQIDLRMTKPVDEDNDLGYRADQAVWIGADARLSTRGAVTRLPNELGFRQGEVRPGGSIEVIADRGYIIAAHGSSLDVSGTQTLLDLATLDALAFPTFRATEVSSRAGDIRLTAAEGIAIGGTVRASAGGTGVAGGNLMLSLNPSTRESSDPIGRTPFPTGPRAIVFSNAIPNPPARGQGIAASLNGLATLSPSLLAQGEFGGVELVARPASAALPTSATPEAAIRFQGDIRLELPGRIVLDAPAIASDGGSIRLGASYIRIGQSDSAESLTQETSGNGRLTLRADHLDLEAVTLRSGSITSTTGSDQRILFGQIQFGQDWIYPFSDVVLLRDTAPEKRVSLRGPTVDIQAGAGVRVRTRAEYTETLASRFFRQRAGSSSGAQLPADAGHLTIAASQSLSLAGRLLSGSAGGRGAAVDIVADRLAVVDARSNATGRVELLANELNRLGAESLLLGGSRIRSDGDLGLDVTASEIRVEQGADLSAPEIILAARDEVRITSGGSVQARGKAIDSRTRTMVLSGDGALLRVSTGEQASVQRSASSGTTGSAVVASSRWGQGTTRCVDSSR